MCLVPILTVLADLLESSESRAPRASSSGSTNTLPMPTRIFDSDFIRSLAEYNPADSSGRRQSADRTRSGEAVKNDVHMCWNGCSRCSTKPIWIVGVTSLSSEAVQFWMRSAFATAIAHRGLQADSHPDDDPGSG